VPEPPLAWAEGLIRGGGDEAGRCKALASRRGALNTKGPMRSPHGTLLHLRTKTLCALEVVRQPELRDAWRHNLPRPQELVARTRL
jgi:hypothetical protein